MGIQCKVMASTRFPTHHGSEMKVITKTFFDEFFSSCRLKSVDLVHRSFTLILHFR